VDWTFLGGSIANWSFLAFVAMGLLCALNTWRVLRTPKPSDGLVH
jgi:disulfide bond formation protein DsbB